MWSSKLESFSDIECSGEGPRQLLEEFACGLLGRKLDVATLFTVQERRMVFRHLSRMVELRKVYQPGERLVWTEEDLDAQERQRVFEPHLDQLVRNLPARMARDTAPTKPCWPQDRPFAVCLSHDIDHVTAFDAAERWRGLKRYVCHHPVQPDELVRRAWGAARRTASGWRRRELANERDPLAGAGQWLKLEADCGFKSSLLFFAQTIQPWHPHDCNYGFRDKIRFEGCRTTVSGMMCELARRGWDVGVHGSIASATEPGVLGAQKQEVEAVLGQPVSTTRQHYLQYHPFCTPALQSEAGLLADGTQGFNDLVGFRAGTSFPYRVWDWGGLCLLPLWQVPLHLQDGALLRHWPTVDQALEICMLFLDRVESVGGCLGLLFHPAHLATDWGRCVYREVLLEARRRGAWGCSMREVATWWQAHVQVVSAQVPSPLSPVSAHVR